MKQILNKPTKVLIFTLLALMLSGCLSPGPQKPGRATMKPSKTGGLEQTIAQSENPCQPSKQAQETTKVRTYTIPSGSKIEELQVQPRSSGVAGTNLEIITLSAPMPVTEREEIRAHTELGAAQKDTARELTAKLSSLKSIVWVGLGLLVFGITSLVWPPLKIVIGSVTTSVALIFGGLALIVLPTLVVGNELLILGAVSLGVGAWFLAHRHGRAQAILQSKKVAESPLTSPGSGTSSPT
jgi:hypothetical protein